MPGCRVRLARWTVKAWPVTPAQRGGKVCGAARTTLTAMAKSGKRANQQASARGTCRPAALRRPYATRNFTRRTGAVTSSAGFGPVSSPLTRTKRYASPSRK